MYRFFENKFIFALVLILAGFFSLSLRKTRLKTEYSAQILEQKESGVDKLDNEIEQAKLKNSELDDPYYQEKIIRDELLMHKPGEIVVQLHRPDQPTLTYTPTPTLSNVEEWKKVLFR